MKNIFLFCPATGPKSPLRRRVWFWPTGFGRKLHRTTWFNAHGQVLMNFDEGRVEEWLEGRAPTHKEKITTHELNDVQQIDARS